MKMAYSFEQQPLPKSQSSSRVSGTSNELITVSSSRTQRIMIPAYPRASQTNLVAMARLGVITNQNDVVMTPESLPCRSPFSPTPLISFNLVPRSNPAHKSLNPTTARPYPGLTTKTATATQTINGIKTHLRQRRHGLRHQNSRHRWCGRNQQAQGF